MLHPFGRALFKWLMINKTPILAFTRDAVPDLFPLYASQNYKAILPSELKYYGDHEYVTSQ